MPMCLAPGARRAVLLAAMLAMVPVALLPLAARADQAAPGTGATLRDACRRMFDWVAADDIRFQGSSAVLRDSARPVLERLAEFAHDCPAARLSITGHTDALGDDAYNLALSEQRAAAVAEFLVKHGVDRERLLTAGAGARQPVADNGTSYGRERNRRIELELLWPE